MLGCVLDADPGLGDVELVLQPSFDIYRSFRAPAYVRAPLLLVAPRIPGPSYYVGTYYNLVNRKKELKPHPLENHSLSFRSLYEDCSTSKFSRLNVYLLLAGRIHEITARLLNLDLPFKGASYAFLLVARCRESYLSSIYTVDSFSVAMLGAGALAWAWSLWVAGAFSLILLALSYVKF